MSRCPYDCDAAVPGYAEVFKGLEPCSLRRVLLFVKDHFSAAVSVMLWNLQPATTMLLVQSFESADAEGKSLSLRQNGGHRFSSV